MISGGQRQSEEQLGGSSAKRRVALYTLGCKVNQEEGNSILAAFEESGWQVVAFEQAADVYIINTCTVTHIADRKSRQMLRRAVRRGGGQALIVACGCYTQVAGADVQAIAGLDLIVGTTERANLVTLVEQQLKLRAAGCAEQSGEAQQAAFLVGEVAAQREFVSMTGEGLHDEHARGFVKIQEGCNQFCTYCIVPYARGRERSKPPLAVLEQVRQMVAAGHREVVLSGIHVGNYGHDLQPATTLAELLRQVEQVPHLARVRLGSVEPQEVTAQLIEVIAASEVICPHLHIPLQAGSDDVLAKMGRHYDTAAFRALVASLRQAVPQVAITTDIMAGFPQESAQNFAESLAFAAEMRFAKMHIFPYSPRRGTPAATMSGQVSAAEKEARTQSLAVIDAQNSRLFAEAWLGQPTEILIEQQETFDGISYAIGHNGAFVCYAIAYESLQKGDLVKVCGEKYSAGRLFGHLT